MIFMAKPYNHEIHPMPQPYLAALEFSDVNTAVIYSFPASNEEISFRAKDPSLYKQVTKESVNLTRRTHFFFLNKNKFLIIKMPHNLSNPFPKWQIKRKKMKVTPLSLREGQ